MYIYPACARPYTQSRYCSVREYTHTSYALDPGTDGRSPAELWSAQRRKIRQQQLGVETKQGGGREGGTAGGQTAKIKEEKPWQTSWCHQCARKKRHADCIIMFELKKKLAAWHKKVTWRHLNFILKGWLTIIKIMKLVLLCAKKTKQRKNKLKKSKCSGVCRWSWSELAAKKKQNTCSKYIKPEVAKSRWTCNKQAFLCLEGYCYSFAARLQIVSSTGADKIVFTLGFF